MHPRRTARESILGALYAHELTGEEKTKVLLDLFDRLLANTHFSLINSNLVEKHL